MTKINFLEMEKAKHKIHFDNLTPLYPDERIGLELNDPTIQETSWRNSDAVISDSALRPATTGLMGAVATHVLKPSWGIGSITRHVLEPP